VAVGLAVLTKAAGGTTPVTQTTGKNTPVGITSATVQSEVPRVIPGFAVSPQPTHRVQIVLGGNLASAVQRGSVNLLVETLALPAGGSRVGAAKYFITEADHAVLACIQRATAGAAALPGMLILEAEKLLALFGEFAAFPSRLSFERRLPVEISDSPARAALRARVSPQGADPAVTLEISWPAAGEMLIAGCQAWLWQRPQNPKQSAILQPVVRALPAAYRQLLSGRVTLPASQAHEFFRLEWQQLGEHFELHDETGFSTAAPDAASAEAPLPLEAATQAARPAFALKLEGSLNELAASLTATYPHGGNFVVAEEDVASLDGTRHGAAERAAVAWLKSAGFRPATARTQHPFLGTGRHFFLRGQEAITRFFIQDLKLLRARWTIETGPRFEKIFRAIEVVRPEVQVRQSTAGWFEIDVQLATPSGKTFPAAEIQSLLRSNRTLLQSREGKPVGIAQDEIDDLAAVLQDCDPEQTQPGRYRIRAMHAGYLGATLAGWREADAGEGMPARLAGLLNAAKAPRDVRFPGALDGTLRDYQKAGVRWMLALAEQRLAGVLADEMGLGKTLQALTFLQMQREGAKDGASPALVVCPTSLLTNWQRETARFTPAQRTLVIAGQDRAPLFRQIAQADLVITSYALLRRDAERFRGVAFSTVILDEAHDIKNPDSQIARVARSLVAEHRFVLTGTPIENSLRDLWSLMHFLLPGYLGSRQDFRERYEQPLQATGLSLHASADAAPILGGNATAEVRRRLQRRLQPFYLARRKREVAKELPEKIEQVVSCELTVAQAQVYRQLLDSARQGLDDARRDKNPGRGRMLALTALLRLRQACCDLRLLGLPSQPTTDDVEPPTAADDDNDAIAGDLGAAAETHPHATSGKLAMLDELLEQIREGNHRVLIFSQFVSMLRLLAAHLREAGVGFSYLDGQTKDRAGEVDRFQRDPAIAAFLISVKAGGTGLNLTGADTVIHFDPWWNPAVEAQATDRAHRIGQTRVVTSYKLIAAGTVEEKIVALQTRKRALAAEVLEFGLEGGVGGAADALSFDDIGELLSS